MYSTRRSVILHPQLNLLGTLPTELLDVIFDHFHRDVATLKACSMVCQTLRLVCQAHIFHTANLEYFVFNTGAGPVSSHSYFLDAVSTSPHLGSLVQELNFTAPRNTGPGFLRTSEQERATQQGTVAQILLALPQLRNLAIRTPSGPLLWKRLSEPLAKALSEVVQLPTLRYLDLGVTWEAPASLFKSLTNIQTLRFAELNIALSPQKETHSNVDYIEMPHDYSGQEHLHSLSILSNMTYSSTNAIFLRSPYLLNIAHLRSLTLAFINDENIVRQILEICGKSLHTFRIHVQQRGELPHHKPDIGLHHLQRVTSLTLSSSIAFTRSCESSVIHWLNTAINTLPSLERLENLTIIFEVSYIYDILVWEENTWSTLNTLLVVIPALRNIHLMFHLRSSFDLTAENERLSTLFEERAAPLVNTSILKIHTISKLPSYFV